MKNLVKNAIKLVSVGTMLSAIALTTINGSEIRVSAKPTNLTSAVILDGQTVTTTAQAQVEAEVQAAVPTVTYTNVTFKDSYNTYSFGTLEEARASINVPALSDEEANTKAINNKSVYQSQADEVLRLINEYRTANGIATLAYDDTVAIAAMHRAAESAYSDWNMTAYEDGKTKRHIRPNFKKASTIMDYYGLAGSFAENYGRYQESPAEIFDGWRNSSSHNALLLSEHYTKCGIGVAQDCEGYFYWIAIFM